MDWRDSILSAPHVPCGLAGLNPFGHQVPLSTGGTQSFQAPGTLWIGGTQYFWPPMYPGTGRTLAPQVPYGLVGLSPFGHQVSLGLEDMAGHAYQEIYFVCSYLFVFSFYNNQM